MSVISNEGNLEQAVIKKGIKRIVFCRCYGVMSKIWVQLTAIDTHLLKSGMRLRMPGDVIQFRTSRDLAQLINVWRRL